MGRGPTLAMVALCWAWVMACSGTERDVFTDLASDVPPQQAAAGSSGADAPAAPGEPVMGSSPPAAAIAFEEMLDDSADFGWEQSLQASCRPGLYRGGFNCESGIAPVLIPLQGALQVRLDRTDEDQVLEIVPGADSRIEGVTIGDTPPMDDALYQADLMGKLKCADSEFSADGTGMALDGTNPLAGFNEFNAELTGSYDADTETITGDWHTEPVVPIPANDCNGTFELTWTSP